MPKELGPKSNIEFEENVKKWYQEVLSDLKRGGFEVTPAEAVFLRQTIRDVFEENDKITNKESMDRLFSYPEIMSRFFWQYYGINLREYFNEADGAKEGKESKKQEEDLFKYVQEKLRKDRELI
jgi:hypothetical protein